MVSFCVLAANVCTPDTAENSYPYPRFENWKDVEQPESLHASSVPRPSLPATFAACTMTDNATSTTFASAAGAATAVQPAATEGASTYDPTLGGRRGGAGGRGGP